MTVLFQLINNTNLLGSEWKQKIEKRKRNRTKMIVKKCKHLQKVKKAKCKIIVEFQSDTDEEDDEIVE